MDLHRIYPPRNNWAVKGEGGRVLIVAGSRWYTGAPIFNAVAGLRAGADLVTVVAGPRPADVAAGYSPEIITYPLAEEFGPGQVAEVAALSAGFDSLVIGGGLAPSQATHQAVRELISAVDKPLVVDAEAIRAVTGDRQVLTGKRAVLTPHREEFRVLTDQTVTEELADRRSKVAAAAGSWGAVILLKGHIDVISNGETTLLNKSGSPFMTKGGSGDILAGVVGAMLARSVEPLAAAEAAAYLTGRAGELAAEVFGEGLLSGDILDQLPRVLANEKNF